MSKLTLRAALATPLLLAGPALAQQADTLEEITVTALRRDESLTKTPASVTVLGATTIEQAGVKRIEDIVALSPGVSLVSSTAEIGDSQVNIRGINGARDAENSFAYVLDGILISNPAAFNREYVNLQQVEVLKGPQGALYGRNAEAGAIVITTRKPTDEIEGLLRQGVGKDGLIYTQAAISGGLVPGKVAASLDLDYRNFNGSFKNRLTGAKTVDNQEAWNVDARVIVTLADDWSLDLKGRYGKAEGASIRYNALFEIPGLTQVPIIGPNGYEDPNTHRFDYTNNIVPDNTQESKQFSAKLDHDFDFGHLAAYFAVTQIDNDLLSDGTGAAFGFYERTSPVTGTNVCDASANRLVGSGFKLTSPQFYFGPTANLLAAYTPTTCDGYQYQLRNQTDYTSEVRLTGDEGAWRWSAGLFYLHIDREVGVSIGEDLGLGISKSLFQPYSATARSATAQLYHDQFTNNVYAAFGSIDYDILPDLVLSAALRYDVEQRDDDNLVPAGNLQPYINVRGTTNDPPGTLYPLNSGLIANPNGIPSQSKTFDAPQPRMSLRYTLSDAVTVYSTYGRGFKSGGFNSAGSAATVAATAAATGSEVKVSDSYRQETSDAIEFGVKGRLLDGALTYEAAGYYTWVHDMQFFEFFSGPRGLLRVDSNIDEVQLRGAEAAVQWKALSWLGFNAGANITDSEIITNRSRPSTKGNKSPYTPDYTATVGANVTQPITDSVTLVGRIDTNFIGPTWFHTVQAQSNPTVFGAPANFSKSERQEYSLTDLRVGVRYEQIEVDFFAKNLLDQRNIAELIPAPEFGGVFASEGPRRSFGVEASFRFGGGSTPSPMPQPASYAPAPAARATAAATSYLVFFDFDKSAITPEAARIVANAAGVVKAGQAARVSVTGHTDLSGSDAYNLALSKRRAQAVADQLIADGVPAGEIVLSYKGKREPLVPTADGVREPQNRRAEIVLQ